MPGGLQWQPWLGGTTVLLPRAHHLGQLPPALLIPACQNSFGHSPGCGGELALSIPPEDPSPRLRGPAPPALPTPVFIFTPSLISSVVTCVNTSSALTPKSS